MKKHTHFLIIMLLFGATAFLFTGCSKSTTEMNEMSEVKSSSKIQAPNFTVDLSQSFDNAQGGYTGNFISAGFVAGAGTTFEIVSATFPPANANLNGAMNATYTFSGTQTFTYATGTITANFTGKWWWINPATDEAHASGSWNIISATGNYATIKGSGSLESDLNLALHTTADSWSGYLWYPSN